MSVLHSPMHQLKQGRRHTYQIQILKTSHCLLLPGHTRTAMCSSRPLLRLLCLEHLSTGQQDINVQIMPCVRAPNWRIKGGLASAYSLHSGHLGWSCIDLEITLFLIWTKNSRASCSLTSSDSSCLNPPHLSGSNSSHTPFVPFTTPQHYQHAELIVPSLAFSEHLICNSTTIFSQPELFYYCYVLLEDIIPPSFLASNIVLESCITRIAILCLFSLMPLRLLLHFGVHSLIMMGLFADFLLFILFVNFWNSLFFENPQLLSLWLLLLLHALYYFLLDFRMTFLISK